eukprot:2836597-Pyramimonas_sp.AAC.1
MYWRADSTPKFENIECPDGGGALIKAAGLAVEFAGLGAVALPTPVGAPPPPARTEPDTVSETI